MCSLCLCTQAECLHTFMMSTSVSSVVLVRWKVGVQTFIHKWSLWCNFNPHNVHSSFNCFCQFWFYESFIFNVVSQAVVSELATLLHNPYNIRLVFFLQTQHEIALKCGLQITSSKHEHWSLSVVLNMINTLIHTQRCCVLFRIKFIIHLFPIHTAAHKAYVYLA